MSRTIPTFVVRAVTLLAFTWTVLAGSTAFQEHHDASESEAKPNVALGGGAGEPGAAVVVPIYFSPPSETEVGSLRLEIVFVSVNLKYERLDRGIAAETAGVDVTASLALSKNQSGVETSTLAITAAPASESAPRAVPAGLLGYITFRVSQEARSAIITLHTSVEAMEMRTNRRLENIASEDATVDVITPGSEPLVSCFLFTH